MRQIAIHTGPSTYLDHLGVLCSLLDVPLFITEPDTFAAAQKFYPQAKNFLACHTDLSLPFLAANYDVIYESGHLWAAEMLPLFDLLFNKKMRMVYCPHGNSDKGHSQKKLPPKDISLIYGRHMEELLKKTGALQALSSYAIVGNYRFSFYKKHRSFYDALLEEELQGRLENKKTILYAPTWADGENPTSFFSSCERLVQELAPQFNLIVKLHPLLEERHPAQTWQIISSCQERRGVVFLDKFPAIYPILNRSDGYIGDFSSIGYDFLSLDKPLFFLKENQGALKSCGPILPESENMADFIARVWELNEQELSAERKRVYAYAFGEELSIEEIKKRIEIALSSDRAKWI